MKQLSRRLSRLLLMLLVSTAPLAAADVSREAVLRITDNMVCTCGCPPTIVSDCSCGRAEEMIREVEGLLEAGKTEQEVFAFYESQFGAKVLAAPKPEGFNLVGWILPFFATLLGTAVVAAVYRRLKHRPVAGAVETQQASAVDDRYRKILDQELSE